MSGLDTVIKVNITRQTKVPTRAGFGTAAFVSEGATFAGVIKSYVDTDAVQADFTAGLVDSEVVKAANVHFSQNLKTAKFWVIKKGADLAHIQLITFAGAFVAANSINMDVNGAPIGPIAFVTDSDTTLAAISTAIQAEAGVTSAVVNTVDRTILVTGAAINTEVKLENLVVTGGASQTTGIISLVQYFDATKTYVESITRARLVDDSWYVVTIQSRDKVDQEAVADYIEAQFKSFFASTNDANAKILGDTSHILAILKAKNLDRSIVMYSGDAASYPELGWLGDNLPKDPGSLTWSDKQIKGIIADNIGDDIKDIIHGNNGNTFTSVGGVDITEFGTVASGEYYDVIRGNDWVVARIQERMFATKINNDKIPYTDKGIALLENDLNAVLTEAVNKGIYNSGYTITVPKAADADPADKAARIVRGIRWNASLQGAIHKAVVDGTVTL